MADRAELVLPSRVDANELARQWRVLTRAATAVAILTSPAVFEYLPVLRREALELALYTFRYVKDVNSVVTFFPPKKGNPMSFALFFDKSSFSAQLDHPLRKTLPVPPVAVNLAPSEQQTVDMLTKRRVLHFALQRQSNGARVLVLAPKLG